jgi:hypothetical protein
VPFETSDSTSYHLNLPLFLSFLFEIALRFITSYWKKQEIYLRKMAVDWTQLPRELLQSISKEVTLYSDYIRFRAVCP